MYEPEAVVNILFERRFDLLLAIINLQLKYKNNNKMNPANGKSTKIFKNEVSLDNKIWFSLSWIKNITANIT